MQILLAPPAPYKLGKLKIIGLLTILFGVIGSFSWAALTPLDSAVVAIGKVKVHSDRKEIQHLEGGIVESISASEGDKVISGQLLLTLDDTFADTELSRLKAQHQELKIREAILTAQRDGTPTPVFSDEILNTRSDWLKTQIESALNGFQISQDNINNQLNILKNQALQLNEQILGTNNELAAKVDQLSYVEEEIISWKTLVEQKMANKIRYLEMQNLAAELKGEKAQLETQLAGFKTKREQIKLEQLRVTQDFREKASKQLSDVKINLKDISRRLDRATNVLGRIEIRSPVDGVIVGLQVHTIGAVIKPGETILQIVPEKDKLIVEAKVAPMDVDKVYPTQNSRIKISSYKVHEFPEFEGEVESISADSFENPDTFESFYLARISIPESSEETFSFDKIKPGMPAEVLIKTGESTPLQYLMEPLISSFRSAWRDQ